MRALDPEVVDAVWAAVEPLLPMPDGDGHPLGCHRPRISDRLCFRGILIRLVTGCSWVDVERLIDRGDCNSIVRAAVAAAGISDLVCDRVRPAGRGANKRLVPLGMRWPIERTNSWLSNFGQLRRNTDRRATHRLAQLALAVALLL